MSLPCFFFQRKGAFVSLLTDIFTYSVQQKLVIPLHSVLHKSTAHLLTVAVCSWSAHSPLSAAASRTLFVRLQETEELILVNIDDGIIQSSWSETVDLPAIPLAAAEGFISRWSSDATEADIMSLERPRPWRCLSAQGGVSPASLRLGAVSPRSRHWCQHPARPTQGLADASQYTDPEHLPRASGQHLQVML